MYLGLSIISLSLSFERMAEKNRIELLDSLNTDFVSGYIHKGGRKGAGLICFGYLISQLYHLSCVALHVCKCLM